MTNQGTLASPVFCSHRDPDFKHWLNHIERPLVFTNGCFDILHRGHVSYLESAARLGHVLAVGVNSDDSVRRLGKAPQRPLNSFADRMAILSALRSVSAVIGFEEDTPLELILAARPDVLVKGGEWTVNDIVGRTEVIEWGGEVYTIARKFNHSTTELVSRIRLDAGI